MTERKTRPKCIQCGAPADVMVTDSEPYCAKHGLQILKQRKSSQWNTTSDKRSNGYAARYHNSRS